MTSMDLTYGVKDKPKFGQLIVFALQQLLAIMAATIAVPAIIGHGMTASAALCGAGIGTLVYLLFTKFRSPVFLGSSFAFLGSMAAAFAGGVSASLGFLGLIIGAAFAGLVYVIIAIIVKFCGTGWINKLMPAVVIGPTVAIIGLSLAGNAIGDLLTGNVKNVVESWSVMAELPKDFITATPLADGNFYVLAESQVMACSPYIALICGLVTLAVTIISSVYGKKFMKMIPFILGILAGYAVAAIFTVIGNAANVDALKIIDFSIFTRADWTKWYPEVTFVTAFSGNYIYGEAGTFWSYLGTIAVAYIPVAFVVFAEHIADHKNLSSIIGNDLLEDPGLHRTLLGDGVGSIAGAFFGGCPNTTYGESVGCVAISGNASVITILFTACMAIVISFILPVSLFFSTIPSCVMGGVCVALYGFIAVSGLKMIQNVDFNKKHNLFVTSTILIAGVGGLTLTFGSINITTVACALILGILVNLLCLRYRTKYDARKEAEKAAAENAEETTEEIK